jgi:2-oxoglutarate/2-oxoacid ferredoxin oxidoreductase subunit alpha
LRHLNPLPPDLGAILERYDKVLVPEMNLGQLRMLLRAHYLVDAVGHNRVRGMPLQVDDLMSTIVDLHQSVEETR